MNAARLMTCLISLIAVGQAIAGTGPDLIKPVLSSSPVSGEIVAVHNSIRSKVGVPPLIWSDELAQVAQNWANLLISVGTFGHSADNRYGENLFEISGFGASSTAFDVVGAWAAESASYQYDTNSCSRVCGHYTQIVWRQTRAVGCGVARDPKREIWVCNYAPFGNIIGEKPY